MKMTRSVREEPLMEASCLVGVTPVFVFHEIDYYSKIKNHSTTVEMLEVLQKKKKTLHKRHCLALYVCLNKKLFSLDFAHIG